MFRTIAIAIAALALIATPALADGPLHQGQSQQIVLTFKTATKAKTTTSTRRAPAALVRGALLTAGARFNGHPAQSCWADTAQQYECAWHGVLVVVQLHKHAAPMIVRSVSVRPKAVNVRLSLSW